ncbi:hypothetical protein MVEN_02553300 [Mycena venus]|uniref:Uncharacterized protein n=1 Tax=Mycena venus TaxID=2733690 RepID=A0A8H6U3U4_9AGAR|nr:hypothetical protein MVEN_02553300 [Mycena venus]
MDPYLYPVAEPGYESDTGERDVPTLADFENNTPVKVVIGTAKRGNRKVLNRKGRAIIRITAKRGWSHKAIAYIFRVSESSVARAVENIFYKPPRDNIDEDPRTMMRRSPIRVFPLDVVDDELDTDELKYLDEDFSWGGLPQREAKMKCNTRIKEVVKDDDNQADATATPQKRIYEHTISSFTPSPSSSVQPVLTGSPAKKPRYSDVLPAGRSQNQESSTDLRLLARGSPSSHASNTPRLSPSQAPFQAQGSSPSLRSMLPPPSHNRPLSSPLTDRAPQPDLPAFLKTLTDVDFTPAP